MRRNNINSIPNFIYQACESYCLGNIKIRPEVDSGSLLGVFLNLVSVQFANLAAGVEWTNERGILHPGPILDSVGHGMTKHIYSGHRGSLGLALIKEVLSFGLYQTQHLLKGKKISLKS
jgi:hypothetical protein